MCHCGAVVKELPAHSDKPGLVSFFNTIFPFGLFFFILTADPASYALGSIYILSLSPQFYFGKGFQKLLFCILAKLTTRKKNISCQDMFLL